MHVAAALGIALIAFLALVLLAGITPFVGIPILVVALGFVALTGGLAARSKGSMPGDRPSTEEASYDPVVRPEERP